MKKVFVSYNHGDKEFVTKLCLDLTMMGGINMVIDIWEMGLGNSILEYIEESIDESCFLIVVLSKKSVASNWVRTELKYAFHKEQEIGQSFILPIRIEDCKTPISVIDKVYLDLSDKEVYQNAVQQLYNRLKGTPTFSSMVKGFLLSDITNFRLSENDKRDVKKGLIELAQYVEMDSLDNQKWVLWELYHTVLKEYKTVWRLNNYLKEGFDFTLYDDSLATYLQIPLDFEHFNKGLWTIELKSDQNNKVSPKQLQFSEDENYYPKKEFSGNPYEENEKIKTIFTNLADFLSQYRETSKLNFVHYFHTLISEAIGRKYTITIGKGAGPFECMVESRYQRTVHSLPVDKRLEAELKWEEEKLYLNHPQSRENWFFLELHDSFFNNFKCLSLCPRCYENSSWGGNVNGLAHEENIILGQA